jgi:hypothetical protein
MIRIKAPRYHDRKLLLARYRLPCGKDVQVEILYGAYKGIYNVKNETIINSPIESMKTRNGKNIEMRAVDLDKLERISDGN